MEKLKSKREQLPETFQPDKSPESIRQKQTIIEEIQKDMEKYHFERQRKIKETEDVVK